jgi:hypothetical protein
MSAMTYQTIADLLADPALGKLPEVDVLANCAPFNAAYRTIAIAAILAVANARRYGPMSRSDKLRTVTALGYLEREHDHLLDLLKVAYEREVPDLEQSDDSFQLWCEHLALDLARKETP